MKSIIKKDAVMKDNTDELRDALRDDALALYAIDIDHVSEFLVHMLAARMMRTPESTFRALATSKLTGVEAVIHGSFSASDTIEAARIRMQARL